MKKEIIIAAVALVILLAGLALWFGLRGGVNVDSSDAGLTFFAPAGTEIIVTSTDTSDTAEAENTEEESVFEPQAFEVPESGELTIDLEPGDYTILASRGAEYSPWKKELTVTEETNTEFYPILFPAGAELEAVDSAEVSAAFATPATLPTAEDPKTNEAGTTELYVDGNTIFYGWTGEIVDAPEFICPGANVDECRLQSVFSFAAGGVENLDLFGEHGEILILDQGAVISALEVDRRGTQNYQPFYIDATPSTAPAFRILDGEIYISDGGVIS